MSLKLSSTKDSINLIAHFGVAASVAAATAYAVKPWQSLTGAALTAGAAFVVTSVQKFLFSKEHFKAHPERSKHSPNLGRIIKEVGASAGMDPKDFKVYDVETKKLEGEIADAFNRIAKTPNAMATKGMREMVFMSKPLMQILNDDEEKAVVGHEVAHLKAGHLIKSGLLRGLTQFSKFSNQLVVVATTLASGVQNIGYSFFARFITNHWYEMLADRKHILQIPKDKKNLAQTIKSKQIKKGREIFASAAQVSTLSYLYPPYLPVYAAAKGIKIGTALLERHFSRVNEYQADKGAVVFGASPLALITALRKMEIVYAESKKRALEGEEIKTGALTKIWNKLTATHPPTEKRIAHLAQIALAEGYDPDEIQEARKGALNIEEITFIPAETLINMVNIIS